MFLTDPARERLHQIRRLLLVAADDLRTRLINDDDLHQPAEQAVHTPLAGIAALAEDYRTARGDAETPASNLDTAAGRRRYVNPGDTVLVILSNTERCHRQQLAGRRTRVHVTAVDAELDLTVGPGQLRLDHADAGIHRDPDTHRLYIWQPGEHHSR